MVKESNICGLLLCNAISAYYKMADESAVPNIVAFLRVFTINLLTFLDRNLLLHNNINCWN